jgi:hypothetical protein
MARAGRLLIRWGLLVVALLIGAGLALHEHQPHYAARLPSPIYSLHQVVSGWERAPGRWVGRTIYVGTSAALACNVADYDRTVQVTSDSRDCAWGYSTIMLTDPYEGVAIPTGYALDADVPLYGYIAVDYAPGVTPPTPTPTPIFKVRLASKPDCRGLEPGRHPCLVAEPVGWAIP